MADDFLIQFTPGPTIDVAPAVLAAREALASAGQDLLAIPDSALEKPWPWRGEEADVRYGLYRLIESLDGAAADVTRSLVESGAGARAECAPDPRSSSPSRTRETPMRSLRR